MPVTKDLAIKKALENNWEEAATLNKQILEENPEDIDTLNRLGFALIKLGKCRKAKETLKDVLTLDESNPIALKNLKKVEAMIKQHVKTPLQDNDNCLNMQELFIEEAGKTKIVELKNIADKKMLSVLQPGDFVSLIIKRSKVFVELENRYIGMFPDHIGTRLIPFMKGGNEYRVYIKSVDDKNVSIFIKEIKRSRKYKNQPSFTAPAASYFQSAEEI